MLHFNVRKFLTTIFISALLISASIKSQQPQTQESVGFLNTNFTANQISVGMDLLGYSTAIALKANGTLHMYRSLISNTWQSISLPSGTTARQVYLTNTGNCWMISTDNKLYRCTLPNPSWEAVAFSVPSGETPLKVAPVSKDRVYVLGSSKNIIYFAKNLNKTGAEVTWSELIHNNGVTKIQLPEGVTIEDLWAGANTFRTVTHIYVVLSNGQGRLVDLGMEDNSAAKIDLTSQAGILPKYSKVFLGHALDNETGLWTKLGLGQDGLIYLFRDLPNSLYINVKCADFGFNSYNEFFILAGQIQGDEYNVYRYQYSVMLPKAELDKLTQNSIVALKCQAVGKYVVTSKGEYDATYDTNIQDPKCQWKIERCDYNQTLNPDGMYFKFKNVATNAYININASNYRYMLQGTSLSDVHLEDTWYNYVSIKFFPPDLAADVKSKISGYERSAYTTIKIEFPSNPPTSVTTSSQTTLFAMRNGTTKPLLKMPEITGGAKQVSASDSSVWIITKDNQIYRLVNNAWNKAGEAVQVSVGSTSNAWVVGTGAPRPYRWVNQTSKWETMAGDIKKLSVVNDGLVVGIHKDGLIFMTRPQANTTSLSWVYLYDGVINKLTSFKWISAAENKIWAVGADGNLYYWTGSLVSSPVKWNGYFLKCPAPANLETVQILDQNTLIVLDNFGKAYINESMVDGVVPADKWQPFYPAETFASINVSLTNDILAVKQDGSVWTTNAAVKTAADKIISDAAAALAATEAIKTQTAADKIAASRLVAETAEAVAKTAAFVKNTSDARNAAKKASDAAIKATTDKPFVDAALKATLEAAAKTVANAMSKAAADKSVEQARAAATKADADLAATLTASINAAKYAEGSSTAPIKGIKTTTPVAPAKGKTPGSPPPAKARGRGK